MSRKKRWCNLCRDGEPDFHCKECQKGFHRDCLERTGLWTAEHDAADYTCDDCQEEDDECIACHKFEEGAAMIICDNCGGCYHTRCVGEAEDDDDSDASWECEKCTNEKTRMASVVRTTGGRALGNVDICYVCQKSGRLLGCGFCEQSYHPNCLDSVAFETDAADEWKCPLCKGEDPLIFVAYKRLSRRRREKESELWQKCVREQNRLRRSTRDLFLWENREILEPFTGSAIIIRLGKNVEKKLKTTNKTTRARKKNKFSEEFESEDDAPHPVKKQSSKLIKSKGSPADDSSPSSPAAKKADKFDEPPVMAVTYRDETRLQHAESIHGTILQEGVELKPYQRWGVNWLLDAFYLKSAAILADEMGLGKTIQTIAFLSALKAFKITGPHLIVVPLSTVGNWARELRRFAPHLRFTKICGTRQERLHSTSDPLARVGIYDCYITTYECVISDEWFFTDLFQWQCIVLDEAHRLKNEAARVRHSLDRVDCTMRVLLTGTPLQNHVRELCVLLNFLFPDILKDCDRIEKLVTDEEGLRLNDEATEALTDLLSKLMLRRTKELVVRLPQKITTEIWLCLAPTAGSMYKLLLNTVAGLADSEEQGGIRKLLGAVIKMRLVCSHPRAIVHSDHQVEALMASVEDCGWSKSRVAEARSMALDIRRVTRGWAHVEASSKLMFLDSLLCQLHNENMCRCSAYRHNYEEGRAYRLEQAIQFRQAQIETMKKKKKESKEVNKKLNELKDELEALEMKGLDGLDLLQAPNTRLASSKHDDRYVQFMYPYDALDWKEQDRALLAGESKDVPKNHKVLVFTQFQLVLDELEKYCQWRNWTYMRLDGSTNKVLRELDTREFNSSDSSHFLYLISTRAGGLGINLVTANHVVLFDEDWNPFVDMQAIDRAHRIGQKRTVHIWKPITEWTVEERMAIRRSHKLQLDKILIQANVDKAEEEGIEDADEKISADHVRRLIKFGRAAISNAKFDYNIPTLDEFLTRDKRPLTESAVDERAFSSSNSEGDEANEFSVKDALQDETEEGKEEEDLEAFVKGVRPKRERRVPTPIYTPVAWQMGPKEEKKILRERKCFRCGLAGDPSHLASSAAVRKKGENNSKTPTLPPKDLPRSKQLLIGCQRCPKVYHLSDCLGLSIPPRHTWLCPWHECSICFRKAGAAGGVLLHCYGCPTTFCFDCFPPDYQRNNPDRKWYDDLCRRGWNVSKQTLITFLCSRCKAMAEQERRKKLTKEQLELENADRKSKDAAARAEAKALQQAERQADKTKKAKDIADRRALAAAKKTLDENTREYQSQVRAAVEAIFPDGWIELIKLKATEFAAAAATTRAAAAAASDKPKKRFVLTDRFRTPGELLKFCENCSLPRHDVSHCIFPPETKRIIPAVSTPDLTPHISGEACKTPDTQCAVLSEPKCKPKTRVVCSNCGGVNHSRRICPSLSADDAEIYSSREAIRAEMLARLQSMTPLTTPHPLEEALRDSPEVPLRVFEAARRELMIRFDFAMDAILTAIGVPKRQTQQRLTPGVKRDLADTMQPSKRSRVSPNPPDEEFLSSLVPQDGGVTPEHERPEGWMSHKTLTIISNLLQ